MNKEKIPFSKENKEQQKISKKIKLPNKNLKRAVLFLCLLLMLLAPLSSCKTSYTSAKNVKIHFIPKSGESSFWKIAFAGFNTALTEYNTSGEIFAPKNEEDYMAQVMFIEEAVEKKADVIILSAIDYNRLTEAVDGAIKNGTEVLIIDSDVNSENVKVRISTDNYQSGIDLAEEVTKQCGGKGKVGLVYIDENTRNGQQRMQGVIDGFESHSGMDIVAKTLTTTDVDTTARSTEAMIKAQPNLDAIVVFNDPTTLGVGDAITKLQREDIVVGGFDNNKGSIAHLETGAIDVLVIQNQYAMGYLAVEYAIKLAAGQVKDKINLDTGIHLVTKENMWDSDIQTVIFPFEI